MSSNHDQIGSLSNPGPRGLVNRRRREKHDTLLGDEPPRILGVSIVVIAVLLVAAFVLAWSIEYQETTPITLQIHSDPTSSRWFGVGYLPLEMADTVKAGQTIKLQLDSYPASAYGWCSGTVESVSADADNHALSVRVALCNGLVTSSGYRPPVNTVQDVGALQAHGDVKRKVRLFRKMLGALRNLANPK